MNMDVYIITKLIMILLVFGLITSIRYGLHYALTKQKKAPQTIAVILQSTTFGILAWLLFLSILFLLGGLQNFDRHPASIIYILLPPLLFLWGLLFWPKFQILLKQIPKSWLFYAQSYRFLTDICLWLGFAGGFVPKQMTFLWLNQDYTVGVTAIVAGYAFFGKNRERVVEGIIWNVFGLILLFSQVFLGYVSLPFQRPIMNTGISSLFLTDFPFIWMWGFSIPFGFALHTASIYQILFSNVSKKKRVFRLKR